ncbi:MULTISPECIES: hypothetical protein [unclassified Rhizobium]|uniref:hypothetical protein n=1 Tax=unclassified Rhizobium TaxID=2613769 RepID=UPI003D2BB25C
MEKRFDILPHETGWIYLADGQPSASYPCYDLALKAAKVHSAKEMSAMKRIVFRTQALNGEMVKITSPIHP